MTGQTTTDLAVLPSGDLEMHRAPELVLEEAHRAAKALKEVLDAKPKKVVFNEETYLEFEDWQTVGRFYGISPRVVSTQYVTYGDVPAQIQGFEATAEAVHVATDRIVSRAEAMCLNDEEKWRARPKYEYLYVRKSDGKLSLEDPGPAELVWEKLPNGKSRPKKVRSLTGEESVPLFQLRSMAQTRACAKAMRNALAWVVVLAGYKPTPAEELPDGARIIDMTPHIPRAGADIGTIVVPDAAGANNRAVVLESPDPDGFENDIINAEDRVGLIEDIKALRKKLGQTEGKQTVEQARFLGPNVTLEQADIPKLVTYAAHLSGQIRQGSPA